MIKKFVLLSVIALVIFNCTSQDEIMGVWENVSVVNNKTTITDRYVFGSNFVGLKIQQVTYYDGGVTSSAKDFKWTFKDGQLTINEEGKETYKFVWTKDQRLRHGKKKIVLNKKSGDYSRFMTD